MSWEGSERHPMMYFGGNHSRQPEPVRAHHLLRLNSEAARASESDCLENWHSMGNRSQAEAQSFLDRAFEQ